MQHVQHMHTSSVRSLCTYVCGLCCTASALEIHGCWAVCVRNVVYLFPFAVRSANAQLKSVRLSYSVQTVVHFSSGACVEWRVCVSKIPDSIGCTFRYWTDKIFTKCKFRVHSIDLFNFVNFSMFNEGNCAEPAQMKFRRWNFLFLDTAHWWLISASCAMST